MTQPGQHRVANHIPPLATSARLPAGMRKRQASAADFACCLVHLGTEPPADWHPGMDCCRAQFSINAKQGSPNGSTLQVVDSTLGAKPSTR